MSAGSFKASFSSASLRGSYWSLSIFVGAGGNALCALRLGEGRHEEAERVFGNTFVLELVVAVALGALSHCPRKGSE